MLGCHCIAEFVISNENLKTNFENLTSAENGKPTLLDMLFENKHDKLRILNRIGKYTNFHQTPDSISTDLCMRNIIQSCLDYDKPLSMIEKANMFLSYIFK